jgi:hypothetical protein
MQINPEGEVSVAFKTFGGGAVRLARDLAIAFVAFLALWGAMKRMLNAKC